MLSGEPADLLLEEEKLSFEVRVQQVAFSQTNATGNGVR